MKKVLFMLLILFSINGYAGEMVESQDNNQDVLLQKGDSKDHKKVDPRTLIPITCVYVDGTVQLTILENLGEIELFVTNQTTGEQWSTVNNWVLQTSTASGVYLVEIVTEDGTTYWGTYTI